MVVAADLADGYEKTLLEIREKLERRITNASSRLSATPAYHRGRASPENLPEGPLHVWLDWDEIYPQDETFQSVSLVSNWVIQIVAQDDDSDQFGNHAGLGERIWGQILRTMTETNDDLGLSGSIDFLTTRTVHMRGTPAQNRRVDYYELHIEAHHQLEISRSFDLLSVET